MFYTPALPSLLVLGATRQCLADGSMNFKAVLYSFLTWSRQIMAFLSSSACAWSLSIISFFGACNSFFNALLFCGWRGGLLRILISWTSLQSPGEMSWYNPGSDRLAAQHSKCRLFCLHDRRLSWHDPRMSTLQSTSSQSCGTVLLPSKGYRLCF